MIPLHGETEPVWGRSHPRPHPQWHQSLPLGHVAAGARPAAPARYLDDVVDERVAEHPVQVDALVLQDVLEAARGTRQACSRGPAPRETSATGTTTTADTAPNPALRSVPASTALVPVPRTEPPARVPRAVSVLATMLPLEQVSSNVRHSPRGPACSWREPRPVFRPNTCPLPVCRTPPQPTRVIKNECQRSLRPTLLGLLSGGDQKGDFKPSLPCVHWLTPSLLLMPWEEAPHPHVTDFLLLPPNKATRGFFVLILVPPCLSIRAAFAPDTLQAPRLPEAKI